MSFRVDRRILTEVLVAHGKYPGLGPPYPQGLVTKLHGRLDITTAEGDRWGSFLVTILFPYDYPQSLPKLFEDQGRIRRSPDWHVNPDRSLCLGPDVSELLKYNDGVCLIDWLNRSALPFLANHLHKERTGEYRNGELSHGAEGIWEYYMDRWKCERPEVLRKLRLLALGNSPDGHDPCHCGSGQPWLKCHWPSEALPARLRRAYLADLLTLS